MRSLEELIEHYAKTGVEYERFDTALGKLEFIRTQSILERHLPAAPATICDIGGGPGLYARWLAECGYRVHLSDVVGEHIDAARHAEASCDRRLFASLSVSDARSLEYSDETSDALLLLGPLYHLQEREQRLEVLAEAKRVAKPGAPILAAAISRFAPVLDGLRTGRWDDPVYREVAMRDLRTGRHDNPTGDPSLFTTAFFHLPSELEHEITTAGLLLDAMLAVEGPAWLLSHLDSWWSDSDKRARVLEAIREMEEERTLIGTSAHFIAVARKAAA